MFRKILLVMIFLSSFPLFAEIILNHDPLQAIQQGKKISLRLEVREGIELVSQVVLFYREQGDIVYNEMEIDNTSVTEPYFVFDIKNSDEIESGLEYFFQVKTNDNLIETLPEINPQSTPFLLSILKPEQQFGHENFVLLSPDVDYTDFSKDFLIAVSFFSLQNKIELNSIKFYINEKDCTEQAEIYNNMLIYKVSGLKQGSYQYQIKAKLKDGQEIESRKWKMAITRETWISELNLKGKSVVNTYYSKLNNDNSDEVEKRANFLLLFSGKYKWLGYKSKLYLSSLETHKAQPVNRSYLSFMTKYLDFTAGDYSPNYGTFLLNGTNVRGIHSNLHFRNFRLKLTAGQSNRAIDGDIQYDAGTFATHTYSLRTEFGRPDAVMWSLAFTKNKDDVDSIDKEFVVTADSTYLVEPKDNLILGSDISLALFKRRLLMGAEVAMSYLNRNIYEGVMSIEDIEDELDTQIDLPIDPEDIESILVINENLEPFTPGMKNLAYKAFLRTYFYHNFLNISYSAVGGSFNSLSSNYLQTDTAVLGLNDNLNLFRNKINLNLAYNLISDNLNDEKDFTTSTANYNTQLSYRASGDLSFRITYSANVTERSGNQDIGNTNAASIGFGSSYKLSQLNSLPTILSLNFMNYGNEYSYEDSTETIQDYKYSKNNLILSANSEWQNLPLTTELSFTFSRMETKNAGIKEATSYNAIYLKAVYSLWEGSLKPYGNIQFNLFGGDDDKHSTLLNLGANYQVFAATRVSTNLGMKLYTDNDVAGNDYNTLTWRLKLVQKF